MAVPDTIFNLDNFPQKKNESKNNIIITFSDENAIKNTDKSAISEIFK